jgi:hypothetical protein
VNRITARVVARYLLAGQQPGQRQRIREMARPINKPEGVDLSVIEDEGRSKSEGDDTTKPDKNDITPRDLFYPPLPKNTGVRNFAETGKDLSDTTGIEKDKGYETVDSLSQYLIRTEGGGEGGPEGV